jgi:hypothetical protein
LARRLYLLNEKIAAPRTMELGMVDAVLPPAELNAYTYEVAGTLVRTPATLLARATDNLNAAEDEVERRRWLFAHEAENQLTSARTFSRRAKEQRAEEPPAICVNVSGRRSRETAPAQPQPQPCGMSPTPRRGVRSTPPPWRQWRRESRWR